MASTGRPWPTIDIHAHAFPDKISGKAVAQLRNHYGLEMSGTGLVSDLLTGAQAAGIDLVVLHAAATTPAQVEPANSWVADVAQRHESIMGFGTMHPDYEHVAAGIERLAELGLGGLKLHPDFQGFDVDSPRAAVIFEVARKLDLVVMCHCGDLHLDHASPERLARVIRAFPGLKLIVAHLGGSFRWEEGRRHIAPLLADNPGLYTDSSSTLWLLDRDSAKRQVEAFGADRILFGTDYPIRSHVQELAFAEALFAEMGMGPEGIAGIRGGNALRVLGLHL